MLDMEIGILKRLSHPHIIRLFEVYETPERVYLVFELCPRGSLQHRLAALPPVMSPSQQQLQLQQQQEEQAKGLTRQQHARFPNGRPPGTGGLSVRAVVSIVGQLAQAVAYLHDLGRHPGFLTWRYTYFEFSSE